MAKYYDKKSDKVIGISNDEARKFTRECICTALVKVMAVKNYDKITVTDICDKAGVSRAGFYRNFNGKEDVMEEIIGNVNVYSKQSLQNISNASSEEMAFCREIVRALVEKEGDFAIIMDILETGQGNVLTEYINKLADRQLSHDELETVPTISAYFWSGALINVFTYWIKYGKKETIDELVDFIMSVKFS